MKTPPPTSWGTHLRKFPLGLLAMVREYSIRKFLLLQLTITHQQLLTPLISDNDDGFSPVYVNIPHDRSINNINNGCITDLGTVPRVRLPNSEGCKEAHAYFLAYPPYRRSLLISTMTPRHFKEISMSTLLHRAVYIGRAQTGKCAIQDRKQIGPTDRYKNFVQNEERGCPPAANQNSQWITPTQPRGDPQMHTRSYTLFRIQTKSLGVYEELHKY